LREGVFGLSSLRCAKGDHPACLDVRSFFKDKGEYSRENGFVNGYFEAVIVALSLLSA